MAASASQLTPFRGHFNCNNDDDDDDDLHHSDVSKETSSSSNGSNSRRNSVSGHVNGGDGGGFSHYQPLFMDPLTDDELTPIGASNK